jgi:hypothetical protein
VVTVVPSAEGAIEVMAIGFLKRPAPPDKERARIERELKKLEREIEAPR